MVWSALISFNRKEVCTNIYSLHLLHYLIFSFLSMSRMFIVVWRHSKMKWRSKKKGWNFEPYTLASAQQVWCFSRSFSRTPPNTHSTTPRSSAHCSLPELQAIISVCGSIICVRCQDVVKTKVSCLIVAVFLGEEEKTGSDFIRVRRQNGDGSLGSAPPGWSIRKAAEPLKTNLSGWRRERTRLTLVQF